MEEDQFNLILRQLKYDEQAFNVLYEYACGILYKHIKYRFGQLDYAEDVVHEFMLYLLYKYEPNEYVDNPAAWLCRSVDRRIINEKKKKENNYLPLNESYVYKPCFEDKVEISGPKFRAAWGKLKAVSRDILILKEVYNYTMKEIAGIMGLGYGNVRIMASRAAKYLRKYGNDDEDGSSGLSHR